MRTCYFGRGFDGSGTDWTRPGEPCSRYQTPERITEEILHLAAQFSNRFGTQPGKVERYVEALQSRLAKSPCPLCGGLVTNTAPLESVLDFLLVVSGEEPRAETYGPRCVRCGLRGCSGPPPDVPGQIRCRREDVGRVGDDLAVAVLAVHACVDEVVFSRFPGRPRYLRSRSAWVVTDVPAELLWDRWRVW